MTDGSAFLGHAPLSEDDQLVSKALCIISGSKINPNESLPFGPTHPPNAVYEDRSPALVVGEAWAIFFVLLFTLGRLYVRGARTRSWGIDDWVIIPGAAGCVAYLSMDMVGETHGGGCLGKHFWDCTYDSLGWLVLVAQVQEPLFYFTVFTIKLSIALANRRMTGTASLQWRIVHGTFIALFLCLLPVTTLLNTFPCAPVPANYSLWYIGAMPDPRALRCLDRYAILLATRLLHMATDVALFAVPVAIVWRLKLTRARRLRLIAVFAVGGISIIASVVRCALIFQLAEDFSWQSYTIYAFNVVDVVCAAVVASLPALNAVLEGALSRARTVLGLRGSDQDLLSRVKSYATPWRSRGTQHLGSRPESEASQRGEAEKSKVSTIRVQRDFDIEKQTAADQDTPCVGATEASAQYAAPRPRSRTDWKPLSMI